MIELSAAAAFQVQMSAALLVAYILVGAMASFTVGYFLTKSEYRRDTSQILGQKNTTFAIYLALEFSSGIAALATIFYVLFHNLWNSVQLFLHDRQKEGGGESFPGE